MANAPHVLILPPAVSGTWVPNEVGFRILSLSGGHEAKGSSSGCEVLSALPLLWVAEDHLSLFGVNMHFLLEQHLCFCI
jgi:hypothetical protein